MSWRYLQSLRYLGALAVILTASVPANAVLRELPHPALEVFEPVAAAHLEAVRGDFETALAAAATAAERAESYGDVAMVYYGYELNELAMVAWGNAVELAPDDGRWLYLLGLLSRIDGAWPEANELLGRAVAADPSNSAARIHWGRLLLDLGDFEAAGEQFHAVRSLAPTSSAAALGLARTALAQGRYDEAVQWGRRTLALEPGADVAHHHIGLAFRALGDPERARRHLAMSNHRDVSIPDPLTDDLADFVKGAAIQAKHGVEAARRGRHDLAIRYFSLAAEIAPENPVHRYNLAASLRESGRQSAAIAELKSLVERFPHHRDGHFNLAGLLVQAGDIEAAAKHYVEVVQIDPSDREARIEWAGTLAYLGEIEKAEVELEGLLELLPDDAESRLALATLMLQEGRREAANRLLEAGFGRDVTAEEWARFAQLRGESLIALGDPTAARREFEKALERSPEFAPSRLALGRLLARQGEYLSASHHFRRLVETEPANLEYLVSLAISLRLAGASEELVAVLEEATVSAPQSVEFRHMLAQELISCEVSPPRAALRGLTMAQEVMQVEPSVEHAETVAAALALNGDYAAAVSWQERVVAERLRAGDTEGAAASRRKLVNYQSARACPSQGAGSEPS